METIGGDLRQMQRTPLSASHVQAMREAGKIATYPAGTFLARPGEPVDRFVYVEEGEIEVSQSLYRQTPFALHPGSDTVHGRDRLFERRRLVDADARGSRHAGDRGAARSDAEADV